MHILHTIIGLPKVSEQRLTHEDATLESVFDITPLPRGYGMTLGHALRRSIISSVSSARRSPDSRQLDHVRKQFTNPTMATE